jgi:hypothetical protein
MNRRKKIFVTVDADRYPPLGADSHTGHSNQIMTLVHQGMSTIVYLVLVIVATLLSPPALAQQFNTDNYWTAPHGTETSVVTVGENYSTILGVVSLFPNWEFNLGATLFKGDQASNTTDHFSTTFYVKHMFYENETKNGGWAVMAGTGVVPGFYQAGTITYDSKSYWAYVPVTFPFLDGMLSWDIMPGYTVNKSYGTTNDTETGFLYSTRLAIYKVIPQSAIVGEIFGTEGQAYSDPQYRIGVRWESKYIVAALTYSNAFDHSQGAGIEFGILILSPQFLCFGGC